MINNDRIVPIQKIDFLSMIGIHFALSGWNYTVVRSADVEGNYTVEVNEELVYLCDQPVKMINLKPGEGIADSMFYFVPAYDFSGFYVNGEAATIADGSAEIKPDGVTLYEAEYDDSTGEIQITQITPNAE